MSPIIPTFCIPCDQLNLVYVQVPKAANSSIIYCLNQKQKWFDINTKNHQEIQDKIRPNKIEFNPHNYEKYKKYFWFTFVRNPYERIISSYVNKVLNPEEVFLSFKNIGITKSTSFLDFCNTIKEIDSTQLNDHIKPQDLIIPKVVHFFGKIENIKQDWIRLQAKIPDLLNLDVQLNKSRKRDNFLCRNSIDIINQIYSNDFDRFKYNKL
jgi:dermatan 4-sulfotransferase 1